MNDIALQATSESGKTNEGTVVEGRTAKLRIQNKHDTEANWNKATNFVPLGGEMIVYDPDSTHTTARFKLGDGTTKVTALPFIAEDSGGGIDFPTDSKKANKLLFGDGNWKEPFTINTQKFNDVSSIYAPTNQGLLKTAFTYAPLNAGAYCRFQRNGDYPEFLSPTSIPYSVVTITTGSVKANTQYTIAVDIHWCSSVTFLMVKKDGSGLITTLTNAAIRNLWEISNLTGFIPISSQTNPGWIKIVSYSSDSSGGKTVIQTGTLDSNVTSGGQGFYVICSY